MPTPPAIRLQTNTLQFSFSLKRRIASARSRESPADLGEVDPVLAQVILDDVHHLQVLREDDDLLAAVERLLEQLLEDLELAGVEVPRRGPLTTSAGWSQTRFSFDSAAKTVM
jgi:hypothetical protein